MFPVRYTRDQLQKKTKEESRRSTLKDKVAIVTKESGNKSAARKRDGWACRFPRCACLQLRLHPEVAHVDGDKGIGGDHGTKSHVSQLMCVCKPRHQDSRISLHRKTLRIEFLTPKKANGPVRWLVDVAALDAHPGAKRAKWMVVAEETDVRVLAPLTAAQGAILDRILELSLPK